MKLLPLPTPSRGAAPLKTDAQAGAARGTSRGGREVVPGTSTQTTRLVLQIVAEHAGQDGVRRVLDRAGGQAAFQTAGGKISYPDKFRLFEAAAAELDAPRHGLRLGMSQ